MALNVQILKETTEVRVAYTKGKENRAHYDSDELERCLVYFLRGP